VNAFSAGLHVYVADGGSNCIVRVVEADKAACIVSANDKLQIASSAENLIIGYILYRDAVVGLITSVQVLDRVLLNVFFVDGVEGRGGRHWAVFHNQIYGVDEQGALLPIYGGGINLSGVDKVVSADFYEAAVTCDAATFCLYLCAVLENSHIACLDDDIAALSGACGVCRRQAAVGEGDLLGGDEVCIAAISLCVIGGDGTGLRDACSPCSDISAFGGDGSAVCNGS